MGVTVANARNIPHDSLASRDRAGRAAFFAFALVSSFLVPTALLAFFTPPFWWLGIPVGVFMLGAMLPKIVFHVGAMQALVSFNPLNGAMTTYGPGWHPRYPWENVKASSNVSLKEVAESLVETFPTKDAAVEAKLTYGYRASVENLHNFSAAPLTTIDDAVRSALKSALAERAGRSSFVDLVGHEAEIGQELFRVLTEPTQNASIQNRYGIEVLFVTVNRFHLSERVQGALGSIAENQAFEKIVAAQCAFGTVEEFRKACADGRVSASALSSARDYALLLLRKKVKKTILHLDVSD
jgi:hypothetical protein